MALSASTVFEVRTGGADTNGGGFVTGASGTDFSLQDAAQFALTGIATAGAGAVFLSTSAAASMVGNILQVVSGTNFTVGFFQILSVSVGVSVTVDRNICTGVGASGVINIGGALATPQAAITAVSVAGQIVYVKSASYAIAAALTLPAVSSFSGYTQIIGYTTTRGDGGRPTITVSTAINGINMNQSGWSLSNMAFTSSASGLIGINCTVSYETIFNCVVTDFASGITASASDCSVIKSKVTGATTAGITLSGAGVIASYCSVSACSCTGYTISGNNVSVVSCSAVSNTGGSSDGFAFGGGTHTSLYSCFSYSNGRDGFRCTSDYGLVNCGGIFNCLSALNAGYGINWSSAATVKTVIWVNNCGFWSNTLGAVNNYVQSANNVAISGSDPTNDPFVSKATGNFALNSTAGAGALLRAAGFPGVVDSTTGYADIGMFQHADPASVTVGYPIVL